jgi:hypothetical protein
MANQNLQIKKAEIRYDFNKSIFIASLAATLTLSLGIIVNFEKLASNPIVILCFVIICFIFLIMTIVSSYRMRDTYDLIIHLINKEIQREKSQKVIR